MRLKAVGPYRWSVLGGEQLLGIACDAVFAVAEVVPQAALFLTERFGHDMPELEAFRRVREGTAAGPQGCSCAAGPELTWRVCALPLWLASMPAAAEAAAVLGRYGAHAAAMMLSTSFMPGQLDYAHKVRAKLDSFVRKGLCADKPPPIEA